MVRTVAASRLTTRQVTLGAYEFRLADASDDARLRALMRETSLPSWITLSFEREPSYFAGAGLGGEHHAVIACDARNGAIAGMCALTFRQGFVNGESATLAYLGELRISGAARGKVTLIRAGFAALRRLVAWSAGPCLTSIIEDNLAATRLLTHGLAGFPHYRRLAGLEVAALTSRARAAQLPPGVTVAAARDEDETAITAFLTREHRRFQFAPLWDRAALQKAPALSTEDFILAKAGGEIIGCAALWDQRGLRQTRVKSYAGSLSHLRPAANLVLPIAGLPRLPAPGERLEQIFLSHIAVAGDDEGVFQALVDHARDDAKRRGADILLLGLCDTHPLAPRLRGLRRAKSYRSTLYLIRWPDDPDIADQLDGRPPHPELAVL